MPLIARDKTEQPVHPQRPLFERIQDWIFKLDVGLGIGWFRLGMFCLLVALMVLLYTGTQFYGLRDREAMEMGQLARNLRRGVGYVTQTVRPLEIWHLERIGKPAMDPDRGTQPELWTPPLYPLVLSLVFRLVPPDFTATAGVVTLPADRLLMMVGWLFFLIGLVLTYVLARELFDHRVAVLSVFLYLFCDPLLDFAVAGLPMGLMVVLFLLTVWAVLKAEKWQLAGKSPWWVYGALAVSGVMVGLGTLTQYAFASVLVPLLVYVAVSFPKRRWMAVGLCAAMFVAVLLPWMARNWVVSRTFFGLSSYEVLESTGRDTPYEIRAAQLQRTYQLEKPRFRVRTILRKMVLNLQDLYRVTVKDVGANFLIAFFLAGLLHRWRNEDVFRLRRLVFWSMMTCVVWLSATGPPDRNFLTLLLPLVIIYGVGFFYVLFERLQFRTRLLRRGMVSLFAFLNMLPVLFTLLPPTTTLPYPPYSGPVVNGLQKGFREEEVLVSDIPWAVAWYADRSAIWVPYDERDYFAINDNVRRIAAIYLTQAIFQEQEILEMVAGHQRFWLQMFQGPPPHLPLQSFQAMTPDGQQILISSRVR